MKRLAVIFLCSGMVSCDPRLPASPDLFVDFEVIDFPTTPLSPAQQSLMNGVYGVAQGGSDFGDPVVGRWVGNRWCFYSQHDVVFTVSAGGWLGDSIKLRGYVRMVRSGTGSRVRLEIAASDGGTELLSATPPPPLRIHGAAENGTTIDFTRHRATDTTHFDVLAHRGGGRNEDRLGISENSIEMIRFAGKLGATGVEVDVRKTRDGQLILFHDDTFSPRTVQGAYLLGPVGNFDLEQITALGKLVNGERIPTLLQALRAVIDDTRLTLVWLDVKDPADVDQVVEIQTQMAAYALSKSRSELSILLGIPSQEVLDAYMPHKDRSDALLELEPETVLTLPRCRAWAPRWTSDIDPGKVALLHANNKKVFIWTVDLRETIVDYLPIVDGILSNYPSLVAAVHDSR